MEKGKYNALTDVPGVRVGHTTLYESLPNDDMICTGVTAILPHPENLFTKKVRAATHVINGFGKSCGLVQVNELGVIESPIMLTNTFGIGAVLDGTLKYMLDHNQDIGDSTSSLNIVVGECNDSYLNSMRIQSVKPHHAVKAIESAKNGPLEQGAVGAGKGMVCFSYKGGIGSASRVVSDEEHAYTVACLILSNFGKREESRFFEGNSADLETPDGSIMMIIATDAPLYDRQLKRMAKRCTAGLGRTGSYMANGSGDIAIAFSTANPLTHESDTTINSLNFVRDDSVLMNQIFKATANVTEEAIYNSLKYSKTTRGRNNRTILKAPLTEK
ncbi:P1 family peptidase [Virgibacillus sp. MSJ-26]|uniref:DmpA family aminopeptidase n=1 Tax=Virgibacillus sp. MSJ-26 TaxID=2841522 RepID=UPI001C1090C3|nr:P1 family peptidase [Virgibacillus sp. MSJ-26]MBU5468645.1 P1 family peptidase [Virgibacillus sp. MSJ-26]